MPPAQVRLRPNGNLGPMTRVFSGVQPSGSLHIGNYLGAVRQWARDQRDNDSLFCIVDLHALTLEHDPAELRARTIETMAGLCAAGLDPDLCTLFVQSHVPEHTGLSWLLECTATFGELQRMTQFKEKAEGKESVRAGLLTYPVLMAADILLYDTDRVPVGDDQRQHIELTRDVALRFNSRYGDTFVVPEGAVPPTAARVMDLQEPRRKMSKSVDSPLGTVAMLDPPDELRRKVRKAVTDTDGEMRYDPEHKPGLANLLEIFGALTDRKPDQVAAAYERYGPLKDDLAEALVEELAPVRERHAELVADPGGLAAALAKGAAKAQSLAAPVLDRARAAVGLLEP
jgi:tryptophanyl-tRNA synthetase